MNPIEFKEHNMWLTKPKTMTDEECSGLHVFSDDKQFISCWKMSLKDRIKSLFTGKIWLSVLSGKICHPVRVDIDKPFKKPKEQTDD